MLSKDSTPLIWKLFVGPDLFGSVHLPYAIYHNVNLHLLPVTKIKFIHKISSPKFCTHSPNYYSNPDFQKYLLIVPEVFKQICVGTISGRLTYQVQCIDHICVCNHVLTWASLSIYSSQQIKFLRLFNVCHVMLIRTFHYRIWMNRIQ
jgi:hypothetical protein